MSEERGEMFPLISYEMVRERNEEQVRTAGRRYWWRQALREVHPTVPDPQREADVIELVFGAHCLVEDAIA
ncbi:MAG TPA: hypothetical protein VIC07_09025 [Acidimicrobiia bacterium]